MQDATIINLVDAVRKSAYPLTGVATEYDARSLSALRARQEAEGINLI